MGCLKISGFARSLTLGATSLLSVGCTPAAPADFNSPEPAARNAAIVRAAKDMDARAIPDLVRMLDSDDPAARVLAIRTLERLTGKTLGYDPAAGESQRRDAVKDWQDWCLEKVISRP